MYRDVITPQEQALFSGIAVIGSSDPWRGWVTPCVVSPIGNLANHHLSEDGLIGERVLPSQATHFVVVARGLDGSLLTEVVAA